jgi:hypothetical protein
MARKSDLYLLLAVAGLPILPGCAIHRQAYYVSPFNGNNNEYQPLPTQVDGHSALYSSMAFSSGQTNDLGTDHYWSLNTSVCAAHQFGLLQFHYGANLSLGSYTMGKWYVDSVRRSIYGYNPPSDDLPYASQLNTRSGPHFFGGVGFLGGINGNLPFEVGEWRFLGVETSLAHEFGDYLAVRRQMPDSIATLINRNPLFATIGLNTELVLYGRHGEAGFRFAYGWALGPEYSNPGIHDNTTDKTLHFTYFNASFHYTYRQITGFVQVTDATKSSGIVLGINYRLWASAKPKRVEAPDGPDYRNRLPK